MGIEIRFPKKQNFTRLRRSVPTGEFEFFGGDSRAALYWGVMAERSTRSAAQEMAMNAATGKATASGPLRDGARLQMYEGPQRANRKLGRHIADVELLFREVNEISLPSCGSA